MSEVDAETIATGAKASDLLAKTMGPYLGGFPSEVQGAALAQLVALHLAGHLVTHEDKATINRKETDKMRKAVFDVFIKAVRDLTPIMEAEQILPRFRNARDC